MLPASLRILLCTVPQDMRCSFDGLARAAREVMGQDPQNGAVFIFVNKRRNRLKVLWWEPTGYCILYKRMHRAWLKLPVFRQDGSVSVPIAPQELRGLLAGIPKKRAQALDVHRKKDVTYCREPG